MWVFSNGGAGSIFLLLQVQGLARFQPGGECYLLVSVCSVRFLLLPTASNHQWRIPAGQLSILHPTPQGSTIHISSFPTFIPGGPGLVKFSIIINFRFNFPRPCP